MKGDKPNVLSLEFRCLIHNNKTQYLDTVNTTFIIDKTTCHLLSQHVSSLIHFLQANPMGIECKIGNCVNMKYVMCLILWSEFSFLTKEL